MLNNHSYDHGSSELRLVHKTIGQMFAHVTGLFSDNESLVSVFQNRRFTYGELHRLTDDLAKGFLSLGLGRGDRLAIWSVNRWEWVAVQLASAKIGVVLVNINPAYRTHELRYALEQSQAQALVLLESFKSSKYKDMLLQICPEIEQAEPGKVQSETLPFLKSVVLIDGEHAGMFSLPRLIEDGRRIPDDRLAEAADALDPDDDINIQYTSGTTGFPKGVTLSHFNVLNNGHHVAHVLKLTRQDKLCVPVPFYHCFGMVMSHLACISQGSTMVLPCEVFAPDRVLEALVRERCTALHGVPTMFISLLNHPDFTKHDLSSLRTGIMAGAPCPIDTMRAVIGKMGMREVTIAYGQTESSPVTTMTRTDDEIEKRVATVGRVMPMQELKIIDPITGLIVPRGAQGEICFRGYNVMKGYYRNPQATAEVIDQGRWLHSGDVGVMDQSGYVSITGRIKEMVIRGGENIYPREIEEFLRTSDKVMDVYVVGVPDVKYGEEVMAWVLPREGETLTEEELRAFCKDRITHFKVPRYWKFVEKAEDFPMTVTGKIQKFRMREIAVEELGLASRVAPEA